MGLEEEEKADERVKAGQRVSPEDEKVRVEEEEKKAGQEVGPEEEEKVRSGSEFGGGGDTGRG